MRTSTLTAIAVALSAALAAPSIVRADDTSTTTSASTQSGASTSGTGSSSDWSISADANQDAWIDITEFRTASDRRFGDFDQDGDGYVSRDEYRRQVEGSLAELQSRRAQNLEKVSDALKPRDDDTFAEIDADGDERLSRDEYMDYAESSYSTAAGSQGTLASDRYGEVMGAQSYDPVGVDANLDQAISAWESATDVELDFSMRDTDSDDYISGSEWQAEVDETYTQGRMEQRFTALDTDGDGRLSREEFDGWQAGKSSAETGTVTRSSTEVQAGTQTDAEAAETGAQASANAQQGEGQDDRWSVWTFRRYYFY